MIFFNNLIFFFSFIKLGSKNLMIVEGQSGAGKTTLIAKIAENINFWKPNTLVITRFEKNYLIYISSSSY